MSSARFDQPLSSIKTKILIPLVLASTVVCVLSGFFVQVNATTKLRHDTLARAKLLANAVNSVVEATGRSPELQRIVQAVGTENGVALIVVTAGETSEIIAASKNALLGRSSRELPETLQAALALGTEQSRWDTRTGEAFYTLPFTAGNPLMKDDTPLRGAVAVKLDTRRPQYRIAQQSSWFIILMLSTVTALNLLAYELLRRFVFKPLDAIHEAIGNRRADEFRIYAPTLAGDEISSLSRALDSLVQELAEGEERFRSFADGADVMLWMTDSKNHSKLFNQTWLSFTGRSLEEELAYTHAWKGYNIHPDDRPGVLKAYQRHFATHTPLEQEYRLQRADGLYRWIHEVGRPLISESNDSFQGFVGTCLDVTEQQLAAQDLAKLALVANLTDNAVIITDARGHIQWVNAGFVRITGYELAGVAGKTPGSFLQGPATDPEMVALMGERVRRGDGFNTEVVNYNKNGRAYWVAIEVRPIRDDSGAKTGFIAIESDITQRKQAEEEIRQINDDLERRVNERTMELRHAVGLLEMEMRERQAKEAQLVQAQKMEAVGHLTGGIAHDFNNLLTVVKGNLELLRDIHLNDAAEDNRSLIEDALSAVRDSTDLTSSLLAFSRKQSLYPKPTDVNALITDLSRLLARILGKTITLRLSRDKRELKTEVDPGQLQNALLNLAINARDAMPEGGGLSLHSRLRSAADPRDVLPLEIAPGDYVEIAVADTGVGMSDQALEHAFEPYFTTKPVGNGSGLGLSRVYGFAKQSGGDVAIRSRHGEGTTVSLFLPVRTSGSSSEISSQASRELKGGGETILVVEDEARIRRLAVRYLSDLDYTVLESDNATEAKEILETESEIDLVFSDIIMPGGVNGRDLGNWTREQRPEVRFLLTTGYSGEGRIREHQSQNFGFPVLAKPYTKGELAKRIRDVLDGSV